MRWVMAKFPEISIDPPPKVYSKEPTVDSFQRSYKASNYLSGKVKQCLAQFLLKPQSPTIFFSKRVFDKLLANTQSRLENYDSYGIMADGTRLSINEIFRLPIHLGKSKRRRLF